MPISICELRKLKPVTKEDDERLLKEAKKEHRKEYNEKNKEKISEYNKEWRKNNPGWHKEELKEYSKEYRDSHKAEAKEYNEGYRKEHKEEDRELHKKWRENNLEKVLEMHRRSDAKRKRNFGYEEILPAQWSCVMHHVDDNKVIPIPEVVHQKFSGMPREEHRKLVDEWMREIRPDLWLLVHM